VMLPVLLLVPKHLSSTADGQAGQTAPAN